MRYVPMIPELERMLTELRAERSNEPSSATVMHVFECQNSMTHAAAKIGMKRITHHDLRHLFATICIESGRICSEGNSRAPRRSQSCVASPPSASKAGRRSSAERRPSRTIQLCDDCAARNGRPSSRWSQSGSTTASCGYRTACVAETLARRRESSSSFAALTGSTYPAFLVGVHLADNLSSETLHLFELWTALQEK